MLVRPLAIAIDIAEKPWPLQHAIASDFESLRMKCAALYLRAQKRLGKSKKREANAICRQTHSAAWSRSRLHASTSRTAAASADCVGEGALILQAERAA